MFSFGFFLSPSGVPQCRLMVEHSSSSRAVFYPTGGCASVRDTRQEHHGSAGRGGSTVCAEAAAPVETFAPLLPVGHSEGPLSTVLSAFQSCCRVARVSPSRLYAKKVFRVRLWCFTCIFFSSTAGHSAAWRQTARLPLEGKSFLDASVRVLCVDVAARE